MIKNFNKSDVFSQSVADSGYYEFIGWLKIVMEQWLIDQSLSNDNINLEVDLFPFCSDSKRMGNVVEYLKNINGVSDYYNGNISFCGELNYKTNQKIYALAGFDFSEGYELAAENNYNRTQKITTSFRDKGQDYDSYTLSDIQAKGYFVCVRFKDVSQNSTNALQNGQNVTNYAEQGN